MFVYQAIVTKYLGPTDRRGSRVKASCEAGTITLVWDDALSSSGNHEAVACALAVKLTWAIDLAHFRRKYAAGGLPSGAGNVFVDASEILATARGES
jgi:hypothetical protein